MARAPSNASIDALFEKARSARVVAGPGFPGGVLLDVEENDLGRVRETLRIVESDERFHCMCLGDLVIELRGRWRSAGRISFHHGISLRLDGWSSDARLVDGPALLRYLAERGVVEPLRDYERALEEGKARGSAREEWVAAAPAAIRGSLAELENGPLGMPRSLEPNELDAVIARIREGATDRELARTLLLWLAKGRGPWSGYAAYESVPIRLLERLPVEAVVEAAMAPESDDATIASAARFFGDHQVVTFRKSVLAAVPDAFFERARPLLTVEDDRRRHDHAARTAKAGRRARGAPYPIGDGLEVIGESTDGPLSGLCAIGDVLVSADVRTIVRFDPDSVAAVPIADARDTYLYLPQTGPLAWAAGRLGEIATERGPIARGENSPVEIASSEHGVAWIAKEGNDDRCIRAIANGEVRTLANAGMMWCIAMDGDRVLWIEDAWWDTGTLRSAPITGGKVVRIASVPKLGPSMASPRIAIESGDVLIGVGDHVMIVDAAGRSRRLVESDAPIRAIAASPTHVALVIGEESTTGDPPWSLAAAPRTGGKARTIATFARRPYHRHPLVIARGRACTISDESVIAAPL